MVIYFRLNFVDLNAIGVPEVDMASYMEFKEEMQTKVSEIQRQWFYVPSEMLQDNFNNEVPYKLEGLLNEETVQESFEEDGVEKTYENALYNAPSTLFGQGLIPMDVEDPNQQKKEPNQKLSSFYLNSNNNWRKKHKEK